MESEDKRHELRRRIPERFLEIPGPGAGPDLELYAFWETLRSSSFGAALETLGYAKRQHKYWFDDNTDEIHLLLDTQHRARDVALSNPGSAGLGRRWLDLGFDTQRTLRRIQNQWWEEKAREIQSLADVNDSRGFYDAVKLAHGPTSRTDFLVRSADGVTLNRDSRLILNIWTEHFSFLLNRRNPVDLGILGLLPEYPIPRCWKWTTISASNK